MYHVVAVMLSVCLLLLLLQDGGSVTAGNSSPITDGACALVLVSAAKAAELGCPVLAVVRGYGDANQAPEWFTTGGLVLVGGVEEGGRRGLGARHHSQQDREAVQEGQPGTQPAATTQHPAMHNSYC